MKKAVSVIATLVLLFSCITFASADNSEGVFVPNYKSFMESFIAKVESIDPGLAEAIRKDCYVNGEWGSPSDSINRVRYWDVDPELRLYESSDYLRNLYITIENDEITESEELYKKLMLAAATSIIPNADATFEQTLFENLYYDYVKDSPAGYITIYWNCGVYLFKFSKSSDEYSFEISLSLYEV